jgi:hypothetical protein
MFTDRGFYNKNDPSNGKQTTMSPSERVEDIGKKVKES